MNFHVDFESPDVIAGWLTPDNPGVSSKLVIEVPDRNPVEFESNILRPDIKDLGWHSTGQVGFHIDHHVVPDIHTLDELVLKDFHTGLPIYRRADKTRYIDGKLMLFDCSMMPQWRLNRSIGECFSLQYSSIEQHSLETCSSILRNFRANSILANGMPNFQRYFDVLTDRQFRCIALLRPPLEELAERLLFLKALERMPAESSFRLMFGAYENLLGRFRDADLTNKKSISALLRGLDGHDREIMRSPITRTFGAEVTEAVDRRKVPIALENLAKLDFVGRRTDYLGFCAVFDGLLGRNVLMASGQPAELSMIPGTAEFAARLRKIGPATDLVEEDLALYEFAEEALNSSQGLTL